MRPLPPARRRAKLVPLIVLAVVVPICVPALAAEPSPAPGAPTAEELDAAIRELSGDWPVPGFAVAVVRDGEVILARGYGRRSIEESEAVDAETLFALGSPTKAFTATLLAGLVAEGQLDWDDPVHRHLPAFELHDADLTARVTVRDLLGHRTGLGPQGNFLWYGSGLSRPEILARLRHLEPLQPFRAAFGYQNLGYLAAGELVPALTGESWDDRLRSHLLEPLGLEHAVTRTAELREVDNRAAPHARIEGELCVVPHRDVDSIAPAGGLYVSATDLAAWLRYWVPRYWVPGTPTSAPIEGSSKVPGTPTSAPIEGSSKVPGTPTWPDRRQADELLRPQTLMPVEAVDAGTPPFDTTHFLAYGFGWLLQDYRSHKVAWHGGSIDGMQSQVGLVPELGVGLAVLTNFDGENLAGALFWSLLDHHLGIEDGFDWGGWYREIQEAQESRQAARVERRESARVPGTPTSREPDAYVGEYHHPAYGVLRVERGSGEDESPRLEAHFGPQRIADLEHWHYDTWLATWRDPLLGRGLVTFVLGADGEVSEARVEGIADFERRR